MYKLLDDYRPYGHWLLRIVLFSVFFIHGMGNLLNLDVFATAIHMPPFFALLLALGEVVGASLVLAGGHYHGHYSRIGAILLIVIGFVIMFTVHLGNWTLTIGKSHVGSSMEFMMVLFLIALYVGLKDDKV